MAIGANGSNGTVRRYSRSARVVTEVQGNYTPAAASQAEMFDTVKGGFDQAVKFMRPAVTQEQTMKGEEQANEAFEKGTFEMRSPFSIRDQAFNKTGELLVTNRAMIELDEGFRSAMAKADGNMRVLEQELQSVHGQFGDYPKIPGLQTAWTESFERGAVTARRQTTELAQRRAVAAARQAAADAAANAASETERLAFSAGSVDDVTAAITSGVDRIAQFGPRGEFTVNGVTYPADPSRQGTLSPRQIQNQADALSNSAHELFLRADLARSDNPGEWSRQLSDQWLAGESPLPPGATITLLNQLQTQARTRENALRTDENRIEADMAADLDQGLSPWLTSLENGQYELLPQAEQDALRERASSNPRLLSELNNQLAAGEVIVELAALPAAERMARIEEMQAQFEASPGVSPREAAVINAMAPFVTATRKSLLESTQNMTTANEALIGGGGYMSDEVLEDMRAGAAGDPDLAREVEVLAQAQAFIRDNESMSGEELEEMSNNLESMLSENAARGGRVGAEAALRLEGLELAMTHFDTLGELANSDPAKFARLQGMSLEPFPADPDSTVADIVNTITNRVQSVVGMTSQYGNETPVPLGASEKAMLSELIQESRGSQRVAIVEQLYEGLNRDQANAVLDQLGEQTPEIRAAGSVFDSHPGAVSVILAGVGMTIQGDTPTNRADAQSRVLKPFVGMLSEDGINRAMEIGMAYAKGLAAQAGNTEIQIADLEKGIDIAMGADQDGNGGIEEVKYYGTSILPTGVSGDALGRAFYNLPPTGAFDLLGGNPEDRDGNLYTTEEFVETVSGFMPDPEDPGRLIPVDMRGDAFRVGNSLASFAVKDLIGG